VANSFRFEQRRWSAIIAEASKLIGCGGLGDDLEEAIIFSRRLREQQTFQC
jgi:hypothetical protein